MLSTSSHHLQAMIYFNSKDRDRDGRISFDEFCDRETVAERAFRAMDTNGDGYVSKAEMLQASSRGARRQVTVIRVNQSNADRMDDNNVYQTVRLDAPLNPPRGCHVDHKKPLNLLYWAYESLLYLRRATRTRFTSRSEQRGPWVEFSEMPSRGPKCYPEKVLVTAFPP